MENTNDHFFDIKYDNTEHVINLREISSFNGIRMTNSVTLESIQCTKIVMRNNSVLYDDRSPSKLRIAIYDHYNPRPDEQDEG